MLDGEIGIILSKGIWADINLDTDQASTSTLGTLLCPQDKLWCKHGDTCVSMKYISEKEQTFWITPQSGWHISIMT